MVEAKADRPANSDDEIEVTPEMIDAGAAAMASYDPRFDTLESIAAEVFRAMIGLSREGQEASLPLSLHTSCAGAGGAFPDSVEKRRDDALRRALSTPPKPKQESEKGKPKPEKEKPAK